MPVKDVREVTLPFASNVEVLTFASFPQLGQACDSPTVRTKPLTVVFATVRVVPSGSVTELVEPQANVYRFAPLPCSVLHARPLAS